MVALLKALVSGDTTGAKDDLAKLKADLKAQQAADTSGANLTKDVTSLLKDLTSGNISAAKTDATNLQEDLQPEGASTSSTTQNASSLNNLVSQISDSLSSGSLQGALQDLATYLVQNGQSTGSLVDTTA
jgi:hypothetical protein